jgi:prepilin-type N-terminal cleavage/methylation domain-containing protein
MNKTRSFTLVEMIVVIVLIGIMLSITLNISGNQTKELRFRIARENFLANYNSFIIRALTTNNSELQLIFAWTGKALQVSWSNSSSLYFEDTPTIKISSFNMSDPLIVFVPYVLSFDSTLWRCTVSQIWGSPLSIESIPFTLQYLPDPSIERPYEINLSTCKLKWIPPLEL